MYTNGNRFPPGPGNKRKLENGGTDEVSGTPPTKQHNYGDNMGSATRPTPPTKQQNYGDYMNPAARQGSVAKSHSYGESVNSSARAPSSKQHSYGDNINAPGRTPSDKQHSYGENSSSMSRVAQTSNQHSYGDSNVSGNKQHSHRDGAGAGASKQYIPPNHYSYEMMGMPPAPPNQYNYSDKGPAQQYCYKQDGGNLSGHQTASYPPVHGRYGQHMPHNGMVGQGRGWNQRGRPPMRGFRGNQWPPPGPLSGPPGPPVPHPHLGHPAHMVPPLLPPFGHPPPPRGYFGGHLGPRPPPSLFGAQGNSHGGRNQGGHQGGSHQKSKNKKRQEETIITDTNVVPNKVKGGVLLSPENKPMGKARKRNANPHPYPSRPWNRDDAEKALKVEVETTLNLKNESLIIRFPDPELSRDIVKSYHKGIQNVHFQVPSGPRYCFVQLSPGVNTEKVIKILETIKFGSGHLSVEKKSTKQEEEASPESIDPYTLYIGNLPTNVNIQTVKEKFPEAARVDVGFAQRMRYTRYAFVRFNSVDDAIKAYKENHNLVLDSRSIIVRFRRQKGQIDLPGESKPQHPAKVNIRTADSKKNDEEKGSEKEKKEAKEEDDDDDKDDEEDDEDEDDDEEDNVDDDDDDDDDDGEGEAEDDDDDDDDEEEGRKPLDDDDDDDEEDDQIGGPTLPADDDDDDDDDNIFRELDAQLGGYEGFPFNFN